MRKVLVLCPTQREYRDLPALAQALDCELVFNELCGDYFDRHLVKHPPEELPVLDILALIEETVARYRHAGLSGVTSGVGYPGMSVASIVARRLGLPGPAPEAVMCCEHKYHSRLAQKALFPEAVPRFCLLDASDAEAAIGRVGLPAFVKPVKSCMSMHAHRIDTAAELREIAPSVRLPRGFVQPFEDMLKAYTRYPRAASALLLESLLAGSRQHRRELGARAGREVRTHLS